jgi:hypothetical protein
LDRHSGHIGRNMGALEKTGSAECKVQNAE